MVTCVEMHFGSFESTPEARVALGYSNFPRASYLDERTLTYEPIVNGKLTIRSHRTTRADNNAASCSCPVSRSCNCN